MYMCMHVYVGIYVCARVSVYVYAQLYAGAPPLIPWHVLYIDVGFVVTPAGSKRLPILYITIAHQLGGSWVRQVV